jgi:23S rRNA pseudouridine2605 synthase
MNVGIASPGMRLAASGTGGTGFCYQAAIMISKGSIDERPGERIAKAIARAGLASRREAEVWIAAGRVAVNGKPIASPALNVVQTDRITVDGRPLPMRERTRLFLFHKPRGLVTTHADPQGRPTVFDALPAHLPRLISIGRLDANTEGLLLLTNDGGLARTLELPATGWTRRYRVRANGRITQLRLDRLRHGIEIDGVRYGPIDARLDREQGANVWLTFAMREGKNREVKNVLGHLGLAVNRLIRVSFGPFQLGELPERGIEEVRTRHLREQLGERIAAAAGLDFAGPALASEPPHPGGLTHNREGAGAARPRQIGGRRKPVVIDERGSPEQARDHGQRTAPPVSPATPARRGKLKPHDTLTPALPRKKNRRHGADSLGEPERARRERRQGRRPSRASPPSRKPR